MKEKKSHPKHLKKKDGWNMLHLEMRKTERVELDEVLLITGKEVEVGEFIQRGKLVRLIYRPKS